MTYWLQYVSELIHSQCVLSIRYISLALILSGLASCVSKESMARDLFSKRYNCYAVDVTSSRNGKLYYTRGCSRQATYECDDSLLITPWFWTSSVTCTELVSSLPVPYESRKLLLSEVERVYDEKHRLQAVRGRFFLRNGTRVVFVGSPEYELSTILVTASRVGTAANRADCKLEALVNEKPIPNTDEERRKEPARSNTIAARFTFQDFKPLAQRYGTFGIRLCGKTWKFSEAQLNDLKKFFVIYSEIAQEILKNKSEETSDNPSTI